MKIRTAIILGTLLILGGLSYGIYEGWEDYKNQPLESYGILNEETGEFTPFYSIYSDKGKQILEEMEEVSDNG